MAISAKADEKQIDSNNSFGSWYSVPKDSVVNMVFLCDLFGADGITDYLECNIGSGKGKDFLTIPCLSKNVSGKLFQADNDPCKIIGLESKLKHIAPVIVLDSDTKEWSEPMYFRFGKQVFDELRQSLSDIRAEIDNGAKDLSFKGAIMRVTRDDQQKNGFTKYSVRWLGRHWNMLNNGIVLPENTLEMDKGILGFEYTNESDVRSKLITKLQSKGELKHNGKTIIELLREHDLLTDDSDDDDYEVSA
jgi:hypothetical protein